MKWEIAADAFVFVTAADADPNSKADTSHVRHFRSGNCQAIFQPSNFIHLLELA